jgi:hypothetical protein
VHFLYPQKSSRLSPSGPSDGFSLFPISSLAESLLSASVAASDGVCPLGRKELLAHYAFDHVVLDAATLAVVLKFDLAETVVTAGEPPSPAF